jgi:hypothetical protein
MIKNQESRIKKYIKLIKTKLEDKFMNINENLSKYNEEKKTQNKINEVYVKDS